MKYRQTFGDLYNDILSRLKQDNVIINTVNDIAVLTHQNPPWWNNSITVYNKYIDNENRRIEWHRRILKGCYFGTKDIKSISGTEVHMSNTLIARVPYNAEYLPAYEWLKSEKSKYFTFQPGDIVVGGESDIDIDENVKGFRSDDLLSQLPGVAFMIKVFADNTNAEPRHYKIEG